MKKVNKPFDINDRLHMLPFLVARLRYDRDLGKLYWIPKPAGGRTNNVWNALYAGKEAGCINAQGYRNIVFRMKGEKIFQIRAHQVIWYIEHGKLPTWEIDHINHNRLDNGICNIRDFHRGLNQRNRPLMRTNTSGASGVTWKKKLKKWCAQSCGPRSVTEFIGYFNTVEEASKAVKEYRSKYGFTEQHGMKHEKEE